MATAVKEQKPKLRTLREDGQNVNVRLYREIVDAWKQLAEREGLTKTAWLVRQITLKGREVGLLPWPGRKKEIPIE